MLLASADDLGLACAWIVLLFVGLGVWVAITYARRRRGLAAIQRRWGGVSVPAGEGEDATTATLRFEDDGQPATLVCHTGGEGESSSTELEVRFAADTSLSVVPRGLFDGSVDRDQPVGDPEFDRVFRVACDLPARARELLDAEARQDLLALDRLGAGLFDRGARLFLGKKGAAVRLPRDLLPGPHLEPFVERALALLGRLRRAR